MNTKKLVVTALAIALLSGGAVFAGNGKGNNGNGNGNGGSARESGSSNNGAIASELKWRNAGHASAQAFLNANPDSAVGKLATLKSASDALAAALLEAGLAPDAVIRDPLIIQGELDGLTAPARSSEIVQGDINDPLIPLTQELQDELTAALAYEALEDELALSLSLAGVLADEASAATVVGIDDLTEPAIAALWALLDGK